MKGQFWVIEGTDGVGKTTQATLLGSRLQALPYFWNQKIIQWHFPNYADSPWGTLISEYLAGDLGTVHEVGPQYAGLLYAADRGKQSKAIQAALDNGDWVIADRYSGSNLAHQGAKIADRAKRDAYQQWLVKVEYEHFQIAKPTGTILLTGSELQRQKQLEQRHSSSKIAKDIHEKDESYLSEVSREYEHLAIQHQWDIVKATQADQLLPPQEISDLIWQIIQPHLTNLHVSI